VTQTLDPAIVGLMTDAATGLGLTADRVPDRAVWSGPTGLRVQHVASGTRDPVIRRFSMEDSR
jgi:hypothetical protein